jgi:hypothetical protein
MTPQAAPRAHRPSTLFEVRPRDGCSEEPVATVQPANWSCVASKALLRSSRAVYDASRGELGIDLERSSRRDHHTIPVSTFFGIDRGGVAPWAHADENYKLRPATRQLFDVLDGLDWQR